jgi:DNA replication protein DnaD
MGRLLTGPELKTLLGIYDYLGLPAEVILMLTNHCVEDYQEKYGPGRLPTIRRIEKEAYSWANMEILTLEQADKYIKKQLEKKDSLSQIKKILQINGRSLSTTEQKYVESWIDMGFCPDALEIAYDKTVVKTGRLQWKYMDSIVQSWHGKNLHTPEEIAAGDVRRSAPAAGKYAGKNGSAGIPPKEELERMEKILSKMNKG